MEMNFRFISVFEGCLAHSAEVCCILFSARTSSSMLTGGAIVPPVEKIVPPVTDICPPLRLNFGLKLRYLQTFTGKFYIILAGEKG